MRKIVIILMLTGIVLAAGAVIQSTFPVQSLSMLEKGFEASGAELIEITFNAWGTLTLPEVNEAALVRVLSEGVEAAIGVTPDSFDVTVEEGFVMVQVEVHAEGFVLHASAQSMYSAQGEEAYLVATIYSHNDADSIHTVRQRLNRFFEPTMTKPDMTACLLGALPGKLSPQQTAHVIARVLTALRGEMHESYSDLNVLSIQGSSKWLPGGVVIGDRKANFAVVVRHNPLDGNTFLWVAWPAFSLSV